MKTKQVFFENLSRFIQLHPFFSWTKPFLSAILNLTDYRCESDIIQGGNYDPLTNDERGNQNPRKRRKYCGKCTSIPLFPSKL